MTYRQHGDLPELHRPVLVVALHGWIDAGGAAAAALTAVDDACATVPLATFDGDTYIDYRARRPIMELREGINTRLVWADIQLRVGRSPSGAGIVTLSGPEPDMQWRAFATEVAGLATRLGVTRMIGLGAYPFAAPHTRPPRLSLTSPSRAVVDALPYLRSSLDAPAGMSAVLEHALTDAGIPALGLWVQVPHYVAATAYPAATAALLEALRDVAAVELDTTTLAAEATDHLERIERLVAANDQHAAMVRQLEIAYDALGGTPAELGPGPLPSGDDLAAEFERFLREQSGD